MPPADPYNEEVRACFANPAHAGELDGDHARVLAAQAGDAASGARLALSAGTDNGIIEALRFRAWGCPHLIAAAEVFCREYEGKPLAALRQFSANEWMARLRIPVAKAGRILLLEDTASMLADNID